MSLRTPVGAEKITPRRPTTTLSAMITGSSPPFRQPRSQSSPRHQSKLIKTANRAASPWTPSAIRYSSCSPNPKRPSAWRAAFSADGIWKANPSSNWPRLFSPAIFERTAGVAAVFWTICTMKHAPNARASSANVEVAVAIGPSKQPASSPSALVSTLSPSPPHEANVSETDRHTPRRSRAKSGSHRSGRTGAANAAQA